MTFADIDTWIFDLDNTLYPSSNGLVDQMNDRIRQFIAGLFDVDESGARHVQRQLCAEYGTTLRGLMATRDIDPLDFLAFEQDIDYSVLQPKPSLAQAIRRLPGRSFVFTNGPRSYADRMLRCLGLDGAFEEVFDLFAADLVPKPHPETYQRFVERFEVKPKRSIMFDDLEHNLEVPHRLGMTTGWVQPDRIRPEPPLHAFVTADSDPRRLHVHDLEATLRLAQRQGR